MTVWHRLVRQKKEKQESSTVAKTSTFETQAETTSQAEETTEKQTEKETEKETKTESKKKIQKLRLRRSFGSPHELQMVSTLLILTLTAVCSM